MRPQRIDHLGLLPQQQIARAMLHQPALLLGRLDLHKTHGRAANRLADRLGVGRVVLVALDVSLHVFRRHQTNLVTEPRQLTRPIMRRGTGLHANQAGRQSFEELHYLTATKRLPDDDPGKFAGFFAPHDQRADDPVGAQQRNGQMAAETGAQDDIQDRQRSIVLHVINLHRLSLQHRAADHRIAQADSCNAAKSICRNAGRRKSTPCELMAEQSICYSSTSRSCLSTRLAK
jgi:hypothetical protein